jgi:glycosyltransferase involved in cell wall biosynthesis
MTDDGTQGNKLLNKLDNKSDEILFWRNGVDMQCDTDNRESKQFVYSRYGIKDDKLIFITLSRLVEWKRVDRAIELFQKIHNNYKKVHMIIIGEGSSKSNLQELAKLLKISDNVTFAGAIERNLISKYINASDVFFSFYDLSNIGNPLLEAMKCGKLIVTLNNGDTGEVVKHMHNGLIYDTFEPLTISEDIINLINNTILREKIENNAYKYANDNFISWQQRIANELSIVNNIVEGNNR